MDAAAAKPFGAEDLRAALASPDAAAQTALGKRLLVGQGAPLRPQEGAALIASATQKGDGEAAALAAVLVGLGAQSGVDWGNALDYLQQAAENGWLPAQQQLAVLSPDTDLAAQAGAAAAPDLWARLRRSIDLESWWRVPAGQTISEAPHIAIFESFLATRICSWIMERARPGLSRSRVFGARATAQVSGDRSNSAFEFDLLSLDLPMLLTRARIAAASGFAVPALEQTNVLHYRVGQEYTRHFDFLDPALADFEQEIAAKGQRVATFLVYLNDDFCGAETHFPLLDHRIRCTTGGALFFRNVDGQGAPDRRTLHAGLSPTSGEKWLLSQWIRGRSPG